MPLPRPSPLAQAGVAELRSVNAEVEFPLRDALGRRGIRYRDVPVKDDAGGEDE